MFIKNKDNKEKSVNLKNIISIEVDGSIYDIEFHGMGEFVRWSFESEEERDIVYDNILNLIDAQEV